MTRTRQLHTAHSHLTPPQVHVCNKVLCWPGNALAVHDGLGTDSPDGSMLARDGQWDNGISQQGKNIMPPL